MKTFVKWFLVGLIAGLTVFFTSQVVNATPPTHKQWSITQWTDWGECRPVAECGTDEGTQSRQSYRVCSFHLGGHADCRLGEVLWLQTQERGCEVETSDCEEPTPTPTPEPIIAKEPTCEEQIAVGTWRGENYCGWSPKPWEPPKYEPQVCNGTYTDAPLLQGFKVINPTTDEYSWWAPIGGVDKYAVIYGYSPDALIYGIDNIGSDATSIQIGGLRPNTQSWLQVWAFRGECVTKSVVFN